MLLEKDDLQFFIFSGQGTHHLYEEKYNSCYNTWEKVWSQTLLEVNSSSPFSSDGFTRQTKIGALFKDDHCIALATIREADFSFKSHHRDSLLSAWTPEALNLLTSNGTRVSICSYLSVAPECRGWKIDNLKLVMLISHLITQVFLDSDSDVMTGTMRCSRGTDKAAYANGARFLQKATMHGEDADLVGFWKKELQLKTHQISHPIATDLWNRRVDLTNSTSSFSKTSRNLLNGQSHLSQTA